jgi:repressor LexA
MIPLTRRQHEILDYFRAYQGERGISPTLEEIAAHLGVNKVTIFGHVAELERKGVLKKAARGVSRALQLVDDGSRSTVLPVLGKIAAGTPIEAVEAPEWLDLAELVPQGREVFALRVQGVSMIEDAIREGDIVLVERRNTAHNGETVVAVLPDGEATLKRFYRESDGEIRLQPANARLSPLRVREVEIRGVVIGVVRRF